jgi:hypothetical protein
VPSLRQYRAMPENSSQRHLIRTSDPTLTGMGKRRQAPEGDLSSILAAVPWDTPFESSHDNCTWAMTAVLGSDRTPLMSCAIGKNRGNFSISF